MITIQSKKYLVEFSRLSCLGNIIYDKTAHFGRARKTSIHRLNRARSLQGLLRGGRLGHGFARTSSPRTSLEGSTKELGLALDTLLGSSCFLT